MTHQEREAETQRLMAILNGTEDTEILLTESGDVMCADDVEEELNLEEPSCGICGAEMSQRTELPEDQLCETCRLEWWVNYEACDQCHGKRLLFVDHQWYACGICDGTGRTFRGWERGTAHQS